MIQRLFRSQSERRTCTVDVGYSWEEMHADVLIADDGIRPGDSVRVFGRPVSVTEGGRVVETREVEIRRAGPLMRAWARFMGHFEMAELIEVSFSTRRRL
ncbi:MAG: hypothetical protein ACMVY4_11025 [Minwuia sp.]|uniref:hypothetical protein n=1 Tax=Minwuia sp. TaxID=2493630 RepID=UPI003A85D734